MQCSLLLGNPKYRARVSVRPYQFSPSYPKSFFLTHIPIMPSTSFLGKFDFERSCADLPSVFCNSCGRILSETGGRRHVCKTTPKKIHGYPMCYLPHTIITSDLGSPDGNYQLEFNRFLSEDSDLAVFSLGQEAPVSDTWQEDQRGAGCFSRIFCAGASRCSAMASVGSYWPFGLSNRVIRYWNVDDGVIIVDWGKMYNDYFTQAKSCKNKRRIERIVRRFRELEAERLRMDTEGRWVLYGDRDIFPATHAEIAMACRYEGPRSNFENRYDPKKDRMSPHELALRIGDSIYSASEVIKRRDGKTKLFDGDEKAECPQGCVSMWRRSSYLKLM